MKTGILFSFLVMLGTQLYGQPLNDSIAPVETRKLSPAIQKLQLNVGPKKVPVTIYKFGDVNDVVCFNMHDNEFTSVEAAKQVLSERGGLIIKIENKKQRFINFKLNNKTYTFDANRIFSREGIEQTLRDRGRYSPAAAVEVETFAQKLLSLIPDTASCVVALHNNFDGDFSIKSYTNGGSRQADAKDVYEDSLQDADDIALTTDSILFRKMAGFGYNSILQDNINVKKDGSLSVHYGEKGRRYINIETEHGSVQKYVEMLAKLYDILAEEKLSKAVPETAPQEYPKISEKTVDN
ncbi:MAG TPA: hypothetical protein PKA77_11255 [Chitinophagaceae bacterium]|nr:hypothetical protein [Chitinophagaceae bacterium]HMU59457.1 hypothetical protein [Chitinophagaceae bacterium]